MSRNPYFLSAASWDDAAELVTFTPRQPRYTAGASLTSLDIHVRDHRQRELPMGQRSLEAHYGTFVLVQAHKGIGDARKAAVETSYGRDPTEATILGHEARIYPLGPEPEPGDPDGRMPAIVVWHDDGMFYLIASHDLAPNELVEIAMSLYVSSGQSGPGRQA